MTNERRPGYRVVIIDPRGDSKYVEVANKLAGDMVVDPTVGEVEINQRPTYSTDKFYEIVLPEDFDHNQLDPAERAERPELNRRSAPPMVPVQPSRRNKDK